MARRASGIVVPPAEVDLHHQWVSEHTGQFRDIIASAATEVAIRATLLDLPHDIGTRLDDLYALVGAVPGGDTVDVYTLCAYGAAWRIPPGRGMQPSPLTADQITAAVHDIYRHSLTHQWESWPILLELRSRIPAALARLEHAMITVHYADEAYQRREGYDNARNALDDLATVPLLYRLISDIDWLMPREPEHVNYPADEATWFHHPSEMYPDLPI